MSFTFLWNSGEEHTWPPGLFCLFLFGGVDGYFSNCMNKWLEIIIIFFFRQWQVNYCSSVVRALSLHCRHNLTLVSNLELQAVPTSLFCAPNRLNEVLEMHFEFSFILIGKSTMVFLTGQSWCILESRYTAQDEDFGTVLQTDLTRVQFCLRYRLYSCTCTCRAHNYRAWYCRFNFWDWQYLGS